MFELTRTKFPNAHFSVSQLEVYLQCPYKYKLTYVDKLKWPMVPMGAAFGDAMHQAIETLNKFLFIDDYKAVVEEAVSLWDGAWDVQLAYSKIEYKKDYGPDSLRRQGRTLITMYFNQFSDWRPQIVEETFEVPIPGRKHRKPKTIRGRMDLVVDDTIVELKTSSRTYAQSEVDNSLQLTTYAWAYKQLYGRLPIELKTVVLVRTKVPKICTLVTQRTEQDCEELMGIIAPVIRAIKLKTFHKNYISKYGCGSCTFRTICRGEKE